MKIHEYAQQFTWKNNAKKLIQIYDHNLKSNKKYKGSIDE